MQFPQSTDITQVSNDSSTEAAKRATVAAAIWTAAETPTTKTTSSLDLSALSVESLLHIVDELQQQGYGVTSASTGHITITWA